MGRVYEEFTREREAEIRAHVAHYCVYPQAASPDATQLRGTQLSFYPRTWLAYLQPNTAKAEKYFFLVQFRRGRGSKIKCLIPMASVVGAVDRANRQLKLALKTDNVLDYLNFYYAFTPKEDRFAGRVAQFAVPQNRSDFDVAAAAGQEEPDCSEACLLAGAVWHFLDTESRQRFVAVRCRLRPLSRHLSGRACLHLEDAVFAADFRLRVDNGVPVLSNPELLYQSAALAKPVPFPKRLLPIPSYIQRGEKLLRLKNWIDSAASKFVRRTLLVILWLATLTFLGLIGVSALFPIFEWLGAGWLRSLLQAVGERTGHYRWHEILLGLSTLSILLVLWVIYYKANIDKIFNWVFHLCPSKWERKLADWLNPLIDRHDRDLIAQDTFFKRSWLALRLLTVWTTFMVLAFASVQIALNATGGQAEALSIVVTLAKQALLNIPLVVYVMVRHPWIFGKLAPSEITNINGTLLFLFHLVIAAIILKGVYRIWVFTKEASPRVFYRKLITHR